jgi:hypothetical protein
MGHCQRRARRLTGGSGTIILSGLNGWLGTRGGRLIAGNDYGAAVILLESGERDENKNSMSMLRGDDGIDRRTA